ncbi:MAG: hypothetical protein WA323_14870 [Candidatus Nitrosopolaris sp.]
MQQSRIVIKWTATIHSFGLITTNWALIKGTCKLEHLASSFGTTIVGKKIFNQSGPYAMAKPLRPMSTIAMHPM